MKNSNIKNLGKIIPKKIRLQVYIDTLAYINKNFREKGYTNKPESNDGLCLLLPAILWGLSDYGQNTPNEEGWSFTDTSIAFPELTEEIIEEIIASHDSVKYRKELLARFILELTNI